MCVRQSQEPGEIDANLPVRVNRHQVQSVDIFSHLASGSARPTGIKLCARTPVLTFLASSCLELPEESEIDFDLDRELIHIDIDII